MYLSTTFWSLFLVVLETYHLILLLLYTCAEMLTHSFFVSLLVLSYDKIIWPDTQERSDGNAAVLLGAGNVPGFLWEMEWAGPDRLCGAPAVPHVSLSAWPHQHVSQAHAAARLHFTFTKWAFTLIHLAHITFAVIIHSSCVLNKSNHVQPMGVHNLNETAV